MARRVGEEHYEAQRVGDIMTRRPRTLDATASVMDATFNSFECAIHVLAPTCVHCGMRIIGHGLEMSGRMFCCNHCAE